MLTDAFSDCSTLAPSIGSENSSSVRAIGPSVSEGLLAAVGGMRLDPEVLESVLNKPQGAEALATRYAEYVPAQVPRHAEAWSALCISLIGFTYSQHDLVNYRVHKQH